MAEKPALNIRQKLLNEAEKEKYYGYSESRFLRNASNDYGKGMEMGNVIDCQEKIKELRERTGMSRKDFCDYFQIPYRTVTDWESGKRHAPDYLIRLLEYYIQLNLVQKKNKQEEEANNNSEEND